MKENKSLKRRVDVMQDQMMEIFSIIFDGKNNEQQQQQPPPQPPPGSSSDRSLPMTSHRHKRQLHGMPSGAAAESAAVPASSQSFSTSSRVGVGIGVDVLQNRIEGTKREFLKKIKDVFERHSKQDEVFQRNHNSFKELTKKLLSNNSSKHQRKRTPNKHIPLSSSLDPAGAAIVAGVPPTESSEEDLNSSSTSSLQSKQQQTEQSLIDEPPQPAQNSDGDRFILQYNSNNQRTFDDCEYDQLPTIQIDDGLLSSTVIGGGCDVVNVNPIIDLPEQSNSRNQQQQQQSSSRLKNELSITSKQVQTAAPASFRGGNHGHGADPSRRMNDIRSIKEQYSSSLSLHNNQQQQHQPQQLTQQQYSGNYHVSSSVSGYEAALKEEGQQAWKSRYDNLCQFQVINKPQSSSSPSQPPPPPPPPQLLHSSGSSTGPLHSYHQPSSTQPPGRQSGVTQSQSNMLAVATPRTVIESRRFNEGSDAMMILSLQNSPVREDALRVEQHHLHQGSLTARQTVSPHSSSLTGGGSAAAAAAAAGHLTERMTDEYIKQIIQQYKTPKKPQYAVPPTTAAVNTAVIKRPGQSTHHESSTSQQVRSVPVSSPLAGDFSTTIYAPQTKQYVSVQSSISPPRFSTRSTRPIAVVGGGGASSQPQQPLQLGTTPSQTQQQTIGGGHSGNSYNCYFGSGGGNSASTSTVSGIGSNNGGGGGNGGQANLSPVSKKIPAIQPPALLAQNTTSLNHKRQSSCGSGSVAAASQAAAATGTYAAAGSTLSGSIGGGGGGGGSISSTSAAGINTSSSLSKYNLKLNLSVLNVSKNTAGAFQSDRQQYSDRTAYSRLLPQTYTTKPPATVATAALPATSAASFIVPPLNFPPNINSPYSSIAVAAPLSNRTAAKN